MPMVAMMVGGRAKRIGYGCSKSRGNDASLLRCCDDGRRDELQIEPRSIVAMMVGGRGDDASLLLLCVCCHTIGHSFGDEMSSNSCKEVHGIALAMAMELGLKLNQPIQLKDSQEAGLERLRRVD
ncbi:hypothetical protein SO802_000433 [Lithocarpus litseifolius]|uniref:Uncharacterized protein n=1 Tax=Lithocarpus litseifolius TaxID=425828 RepID=A0AAW2DTC4_9ROSI